MSGRGRPAGPTGPVIGRALRLLDSFGPRHRDLRLSEIARRAGVPLSTAHRLVHELCEWGMVELG